MKQIIEKFIQYLRYERNTNDSDLPRLMREESAGEQMRNLGNNPWGGA